MVGDGKLLRDTFQVRATFVSFHLVQPCHVLSSPLFQTSQNDLGLGYVFHIAWASEVALPSRGPVRLEIQVERTVVSLL